MVYPTYYYLHFLFLNLKKEYMEIYETPNPFFLSDIFVFAEVEEIGLCYIKVNCYNRIEEIGFDIQRRMRRPIEDIMQYAKKLQKFAGIFSTVLILNIGGKSVINGYGP